ncbi:MAG: hypothetical protein ACI4PQ_07430, partial [Butyricicoccaceae bacterium]
MLNNTAIFGHNLFLYCNNNPVSHSDPSGKFVLGFLAV